MRLMVIALIPALLASAPGSAQEFKAGEPLGTVNEAGIATPISSNVRVFGSFRFAESCTYDPDRNLIVAMNAGITQDLQQNDGFVSLIRPDGSVHTSKWIGATRDGLVLNHPLGSAIAGGILYAADIDTVRRFDLATGKPLGATTVPGATYLNGIAVAHDGTVYATNTRPESRIYRIAPDGSVSVFVEGAPLANPNGIAIGPEGHVVVVNLADNAVMTFHPDGRLIRTERSAESGNDGLVILKDGTRYVSSVRFGSVTRIRPGAAAEVIAAGIPSAASMCHDPVQNQLVIPMNPHNALAFLPLG